MNNFILVGCGGHCRSVLELLHSKDLFHKVHSIININPSSFTDNEFIRGVPVLNGLDELYNYSPSTYSPILSIGDNKIRSSVFFELKKRGYILPNLIHSNAYVSCTAVIGEGSLVFANSFLGDSATVGVSSILNTSSVVEHESIIHDFVHVAPGSVICGRSSIHSYCLIGANSTILPELSIAEDITIGASATVTKSLLLPSKKYIGTPAVIL
tara:strand:- start:545 stop:1180 length:636 start_codon:yes stop_codon:yes gene_type:complete